jgi:hypothetical protein
MGLCETNLAICLDIHQLASGDFNVLIVPFRNVANRREGVYQSALSGVDEEGGFFARGTICHGRRRTISTWPFTDPELQSRCFDFLQVNGTSGACSEDNEWLGGGTRRRRSPKTNRGESEENENEFEHLSSKSKESKKE